jgi:hypothetical protein
LQAKASDSIKALQKSGVKIDGLEPGSDTEGDDMPGLVDASDGPNPSAIRSQFDDLD